MAANVRFKIRRSSTYSGAVSAIPASVGELVSISTATNNYATLVGKKVYIGTGTETSGQASSFEAIGGSYYTQLLDGVSGILAPSAAIITDANSRINGLSISSAGSLTLNNTGNTFNTSIKAASALAASYALTLPTTAGTTGQLLTTDGTGLLSWSTTASYTSITIPLNNASAYSINDGTNNYIGISTVTGSNSITLGNIITTQSSIVKPNTANAYSITDGTSTYFKIDTTTATPLITITTGSLSVSSGVFSTIAATASLFNTASTTVNIAGAATAVNIGATTGNTTVNNNLVVTGNLTVNGTTETLNAINLSVQDSIITQGLISGNAPTASTTFDLGSKYSYYDTVAKTSSIFWQRSTARFVLANNVTEAGSVLTVATPTLSNTDYSTLMLGSLSVNDQACTTLGTAESIISYRTINGTTGRFLDGVICDGGLF